MDRVDDSLAASPGGLRLEAALVTLGAESPAGVYAFTLWRGDGPAKGTCRELNGSTGVGSGTRVVIFEADGSYYFFFPLGDGC